MAGVFYFILTTGGMFVSLAERPGDLVDLVNDMDPETRQLSQSFCGVDDDQAFGADGELSRNLPSAFCATLDLASPVC